MATLAGTLPALQAAYQQLQAYAASRGIAITVADYGGLRSASDTASILAYRQADYAAAVAAGEVDPNVTPMNDWRPIAPFGSSFHNYGAAFDVRIQARPSSMSVADALAVLGAYAPSIGLRWGASFGDTPHFELDESLSDAAAQWNAMQSQGGALTLASSNSTILIAIIAGGVVLGWWMWRRRR